MVFYNGSKEEEKAKFQTLLRLAHFKLTLHIFKTPLIEHFADLTRDTIRRTPWITGYNGFRTFDLLATDLPAQNEDLGHGQCRLSQVYLTPSLH